MKPSVYAAAVHQNISLCLDCRACRCPAVPLPPASYHNHSPFVLGIVEGFQSYFKRFTQIDW